MCSEAIDQALKGAPACRFVKAVFDDDTMLQTLPLEVRLSAERRGKRLRCEVVGVVLRGGGWSHAASESVVDLLGKGEGGWGYGT